MWISYIQNMVTAGIGNALWRIDADIWLTVDYDFYPFENDTKLFLKEFANKIRNLEIQVGEILSNN